METSQLLILGGLATEACCNKDPRLLPENFKLSTAVIRVLVASLKDTKLVKLA